MRPVVAVLAVLVIPGLAAGAQAAEVELSLGEELRLEQTTLALGHLDPGTPEVSDVHAVDVDELALPGGTLYVCPFEGGPRGEVPPVPTLQERCRGEDAYEDPSVRVGARTWIAMSGNLTLTDPPNASTTAIVTQEDEIRLASLTHGTVGLDVDVEMGLRPQLPASQITVETDDETRTYNGTEWVFYLQGSGPLELQAGGLHAAIASPTPLRLTPAGTTGMAQALDTRTLLDLQTAALGPDERQPIANATRLVGTSTRLTPLVDGALLGHLNGTIGGRSFDPNETSLVGLTHMEADVEDGNLSGSLEARFTSTAAGVAPGLSDPVGVPWIASAMLWLLAGVSIGLGPAPATRDLRQRGLAVAAAALAFFAWDPIVASTLGTSALSAVSGDASLGVAFALAGFEAIAFGLAWLLLALPLRIVGERWLIDRAAVHVSPVATLVLLGYAWLQPGALVSVGRLLAQL